MTDALMWDGVRYGVTPYTQQQIADIDRMRCQACRKGTMMVTDQLAPAPAMWSIPGRATSP